MAERSSTFPFSPYAGPGFVHFWHCRTTKFIVSFVMGTLMITSIATHQTHAIKMVTEMEAISAVANDVRD